MLKVSKFLLLYRNVLVIFLYVYIRRHRKNFIGHYLRLLLVMQFKCFRIFYTPFKHICFKKSMCNCEVVCIVSSHFGQLRSMQTSNNKKLRYLHKILASFERRVLMALSLCNATNVNRWLNFTLKSNDLSTHTLGFKTSITIF